MKYTPPLNIKKFLESNKKLIIPKNFFIDRIKSFSRMIELNGREKILLHLQEYELTNRDSDSSFFSSQKGIAEIVELSRTRVSTLLGEMENKQLVEKRDKKFDKTLRKRKVYYLTDVGREEARKIKEELKDKTIWLVMEEKKRKLTMKELKDQVGEPEPYLFIINNLKGDVLDLDDIGKNEVFLDRKSEKRKLKNRLQKVKSGGSFVFLISGFTGVGKTKLVEQVKDYAESIGYNIFEEKAFPESTTTYFPLQNIFSEIYDEFEISKKSEKPLILKSREFRDKDIGKGEDQKYIEESIYEDAVEWMKKISSKEPLLIFLDDLQWAKGSTHKLLYHLSSSLEDEPVFLVGAYRKDEMESRGLRDTKEKISCLDNSENLHLDPFDWEDGRKFIYEKLGRKALPDDFIELFYEITKGNPLFLNAVIDELVERGKLDPLKGKYVRKEDEVEISEEVKTIFESKLNRLSDVEKEILYLISCFEEKTSKELLKGLVDIEKDELERKIDDLSDINILKKEMENQIDFSHDMIRTATYEKIPENEKKDYHERIAAEIRKVFEPEEEVYYARIARHEEKAGDLEKALRFYLKAGGKAEEVYANHEAVRLYEKALKFRQEREVSEVEKYRIFERLADAKRTLKRYKEALEDLKKAKEKVDRDEVSVRLHRKLAECYRYRRDYDKALEKIDSGLDTVLKDDALKETEERCELLKEKGIINMRKNEYDRCEEIFEEMKEISEEIGCKKSKAEAFHYLGSIAIYRSRLDKAIDNLKKSIDISEEIGNKEKLVDTYNNLGIVYKRRQQYRKALNQLKKANMLEKKISFKDGSRWALDNIGSICSDIGELDKSINYHKKCLDIEKKVDDKHGIAASLDNIGVSHYKKGNFNQAIEYHERSLELKEELENRNGISLSLYNLGKAYRAKGELDKALEYIEESLDICEDLGERQQHIAYSKLWLGILNIDLGEMNRAEEYLNEALEVFKELEVDYGMGMALSYLGRIEALSGSLNKARIYSEHSRKIGKDFEDMVFEIRVNRNLAQTYIKFRKYREALESCKKALEVAEESGAKNEIGICRKVLGRIYFKRDRFDKAGKEFEKACDILEDVGNKMEKARVLLLWAKMLSILDEGSASDKMSTAAELVEECRLDEWCVKVDYIPEEHL